MILLKKNLEIAMGFPRKVCRLDFLLNFEHEVRFVKEDELPYFFIRLLLTRDKRISSAEKTVSSYFLSNASKSDKPPNTLRRSCVLPKLHVGPDEAAVDIRSDSRIIP